MSWLQASNPSAPSGMAVSAKAFLHAFARAEPRVTRPGLVGRDPRNPQRVIIESYLAEQQSINRVRGRCLEFDEDMFMRKYHGCEARQVLKYGHGPSYMMNGTKFVLGDLLADFGTHNDNSYDTIFFTEVLEHLRFPDLGVQHLFRMTAPCGHVLATTPFIYRVHADPNDFFRYTRGAVQSIFERAGFKSVMVEARGDLLTVLAARLRLDAADLPDAAEHIGRKNDGFASAIVGTFRKPCESGRIGTGRPGGGGLRARTARTQT